MPRVYIAVLNIDWSIERKISTKHDLTPEDVRAAILYSRDIQAGWEDDEEHGRRLVVHGSTYEGIEFVAFLLPLNEHDPEEGTFVLKTAIPKKQT